MMYFMEILCNMICVVVVSIGIFRFLLYPQMLSWFRYVTVFTVSGIWMYYWNLFDDNVYIWVSFIMLGNA